jgi:hypothetical protein
MASPHLLWILVPWLDAIEGRIGNDAFCSTQDEIECTNGVDESKLQSS